MSLLLPILRIKAPLIRQIQPKLATKRKQTRGNMPNIKTPKKRQLIRSLSPFLVAPSSLNESRVENDGTIILTGLLQCANKPNANGRIYPRDILQREVDRYKEVIAQNRALGELDHPPEEDWERDDPLAVRLDRASHVIRDIRMEGDEVYGEVEVLPTPAGQILEGLLMAGIMLGISSRGFGSVQHNGQHSIVQPDIEISCWDMVWMPSTTNAWMESLQESQSSRERYYAKAAKRPRFNDEVWMPGNRIIEREAQKVTSRIAPERPSSAPQVRAGSTSSTRQGSELSSLLEALRAAKG